MANTTYEEAETFLKVLNRIRDNSFNKICTLKNGSNITSINDDCRNVILNNFVEDENDYTLHIDNWKAVVEGLVEAINALDETEVPEEYKLSNPNHV